MPQASDSTPMATAEAASTTQRPQTTTDTTLQQRLQQQAEPMTKSPEDSEQRRQDQENASTLSAEAAAASSVSAEASATTNREPAASQDGPKVKQFSEKSLQELADYYLNLAPADIPDTGFVVSGIAGRFPNADNLNELWDNLVNGKDMVLGPDDKRWPLGECTSGCEETFSIP